MNTIYEQIEKLLAQHDYVVVPNLGGFVVQKQSAEIQPDCIKAPFSTIAFNPLMQHADGLLEIEIARTHSISYRSAAARIEKERLKIKSTLNHTGSCPIGNLGVLTQNKLGQLLFSPTEKAEFLPANLGLYDLHRSPRSTQQEQVRTSVTFTLPSPKVFKYAVAAVLLLGLLFVSPQVNDVRLSNQASLSSLLKVKTLQEKREELKKGVALAAEKTLQDSLVAIDTKSAECYHVIVASWETAANAQKYCQELNDASFTKSHVVAPVKKHHVAIQSFTDKEDAIAFMKELKKIDLKFKTAWVLCEANANL